MKAAPSLLPCRTAGPLGDGASVKPDEPAPGTVSGENLKLFHEAMEQALAGDLPQPQAAEIAATPEAVAAAQPNGSDPHPAGDDASPTEPSPYRGSPQAATAKLVVSRAAAQTHAGNPLGKPPGTGGEITAADASTEAPVALPSTAAADAETRTTETPGAPFWLPPPPLLLPAAPLPSPASTPSIGAPPNRVKDTEHPITRDPTVPNPDSLSPTPDVVGPPATFVAAESTSSHEPVPQLLVQPESVRHASFESRMAAVARLSVARGASASGADEGLPASPTSVTAAPVPVAVAPSGVEVAGTSAAKIPFWSKKAEQMAYPRRNLESTRIGAASLSVIPAENAPAEPAHPAPWVGQRLPYPPGSLITPQAEVTSLTHEVTQSESTLELNGRGANPLPVQIEQRLTGLVAELRHLKADSILVVVRPDPRSELHLDLKWQDGRVEIEVKMQRGDVAALSAHWAQLQENLAAQGIRLGGLVQESLSSSAGPEWTGDSAQQQPQPHQPPSLPDAPRPRSPKGAAPSGAGQSKARPALVTTGRSWETWA